MEPQIEYKDFARVDMRIGKVLRVEEFPRARKPAYKLYIDFGEELGERKSSAQITENYKPEDLVGRFVVAVINFPARQIADFMSEVLVLGASKDGTTGNIILLTPDQVGNKELPLGARIC
ncbi:tRNA-binding protein [bacterium]|nr:tRNA-binding protein [bacterium]